MTTESRFEDGRLTITRVYAASREQVFAAWMETSKVEKWWGCAECTSVDSEIEPRIGGRYNHHMTIEGVGKVPGFATLVEYDPPARLAYVTHLPGDESVEMRVTVDFVATEGGTLVRLVQDGIPGAQVDGGIELREIVRSGWLAATQKLARLLATDPGSAAATPP